jgi:hypothetical protein
MVWKKKTLPPCYWCGDEGAEVCRLCDYFLCDECLNRDYEDHRREAKAHALELASPAPT